MRRLLAFLVFAHCHLAHADTTQLPGLVREALQLDVTFPDGKHAALEALLTRPDKSGRFPLVVINHGTPRDAAAIAQAAPQNYSGTAIVFAQHGYAAVVVNRRGYGRSSGPLSFYTEPCDDRHYTRVAHIVAADILAAVARLRQEPWADPARVLLVGHSVGGLASLAAAMDDPSGLVGIVDFAGALGSTQADFVCQPEQLVETMHGLGLQVRVPSLWIFAENDHFFGPQLARQMFDAYSAGGAPAEFDAAPPYGHDGHLLVFTAAPALWWPRVAAFLDQLQLPTQPVVDLPPPAALPAPPGLNASGQEEFASYVTSRSYEKAFATNGKGRYGRAYGQRTTADADTVALESCQERGAACFIYARGNSLTQ